MTNDRAARAAERRWEPPPAPEPLPVPVLDSHTHLDIVGRRPGRRRSRPRRAVGVDRLVQVGVDVASSRWGVDAGRQHRRGAWPPSPCTPTRRPGWPTSTRRCARSRRWPPTRGCAGIGETGLDHFRTGDDGRAAQEPSFRAHIAIAKRYGKPLVIHDRDAHADVLRVLDDEGAPRPGRDALLLRRRRRSPPSASSAGSC